MTYSLALFINVSFAIASLLLTALPSYSLEFPASGDRGAPARTGSGGTRGDRCHLPSGTSLRALMPLNNISTFRGEQASFWLHIPAELSAKPAEMFVSNPQTHEVVYQQQMRLPELTAAGLIQIDLPATKADGTALLVPGQDYFWEFAAICDDADRSRDHVVQGFVNRVETAEASLPDDSAQQAEHYAAAEIWQQTLEAASALKVTDATLWSELLTSVGLEDLIDEAVIEGSIAECCRAQ
jgi:Domain of Unknown Function (DUF928)